MKIFTTQFSTNWNRLYLVTTLLYLLLRKNILGKNFLKLQCVWWRIRIITFRNLWYRGLFHLEVTRIVQKVTSSFPLQDASNEIEKKSPNGKSRHFITFQHGFHNYKGIYFSAIQAVRKHLIRDFCSDFEGI